MLFDDDDFDEDVNDDVEDSDNENDHESEITHHSEQDDNDEDSESDENELSENQGSSLSFIGKSFECTCSGKCLCRYYQQKSTYDNDCAYCGHPLGWHRKR